MKDKTLILLFGLGILFFFAGVVYMPYTHMGPLDLDEPLEKPSQEGVLGPMIPLLFFISGLVLIVGSGIWLSRKFDKEGAKK